MTNCQFVHSILMNHMEHANRHSYDHVSATFLSETLLYPSTDVNSSSPRSSASRVFRSYGLFIGIIFIHFHQALFM